jgi:hypothetical protein
MGLREFPDILLPIILQFGDHIGDASRYVEISLIRHRRRRFLYFAFRKNAFILHSRQGLVMVDLLDNFLNLLKLFLALESDFAKSL